jgi:RND family efflux transporter MFP subunit
MVELDATPFRAAVDQARATLGAARAQRDLSDAELERARRLIEQGAISQDAYDRRTSEARVARARVDEAAAALERARADLGDTVIRAPTDGVVLETYKQPGEIAVPGGFSGSGDLLRLANLSVLHAQLDVNESDLPSVRLDQQAEVVPDAYPGVRYAARVVELAPQIDRQKGTREVEVVVLEPDDRLLPDMSVRVVFFRRLSGTDTGALIPRAALRRDDGGRAFVWIARDGRAERVGVEVGETFDDLVVVGEGLVGGEEAIVGEAPEREGAAVVVHPTPSTP